MPLKIKTLTEAKGGKMELNLTETVKKLLGDPLWLDDLLAGVSYSRLHDDHEGTEKGLLIVAFDEWGDAWVKTDSCQGPPLRFRFPAAGGDSPMVRNALVILALAIKLDNEKRPQKG